MKRPVPPCARVLFVCALGVVLTGLVPACGGGEGRPPAPRVNAVTPSSGPAAGGTPVFISGAGFQQQGLGVSVGGLPAMGVVVLNDATISCRTPPGAPGAASVAVTTVDGAAALPDGFRYRDRFEGDYFLALFDGEVFDVPTGLAQWGLLTADGAGSVSGGVVSTNRDGLISGPVALPPIGYIISPANGVTTPDEVPLLEGGIAESGRVLALGLVGDGDPPGFMLLGRRGEALLTNADLAGRYHVCAYSFDLGSGEDVAVWGTVAFDGFGRGLGTTSRNQDGAITGATASDLQVLVLPDGSLSLTWLGRALSGGVLAGGEVAFAAGGTATGADPFVVVLIREGTGLSEATFQGTYHYVSLVGTVSGPGPRWTLSTGTAQADGVGTVINGGAVRNADGVIGSVPAGGRVDYAVAPDGAFTTTSGDPEVRGGIVAAGDCACWAGGGVAGQPPQIWIWVR